MQICLDYVPKLHLCQMGMKDLRTKLGYQLAGCPVQRNCLSQEKEHFLRIFILVLFSVTLGEILACCASMNEMPRIKTEDEIRRDLGIE